MSAQTITREADRRLNAERDYATDDPQPARHATPATYPPLAIVDDADSLSHTRCCDTPELLIELL